MNSVQRAARSSWWLAVATVVLAAMSRTIPGALLVGECLAFAAIVTGLTCGSVALFGIRRAGVSNALRPALIGTAANGILLFIFVTNFVTGYHDARQAAERRRLTTERQVLARSLPSTNHFGTWEARTPGGESIIWNFTPARFTWTTRKGQSPQFPYEIDYAKQPIWLTVRPEQPGMPSMLLIVEFLGHDKMRALGSSPGSKTRPVDFGEGNPEVLVFERRR